MQWQDENLAIVFVLPICLPKCVLQNFSFVLVFKLLKKLQEFLKAIWNDRSDISASSASYAKDH